MPPEFYNFHTEDKPLGVETYITIYYVTHKRYLRFLKQTQKFELTSAPVLSIFMSTFKISFA